MTPARVPGRAYAMTPKTVERLNRKVPPLMGQAEVAELLGVNPGNVKKTANLPAPIPQTLKRGDLWRRDVMEAFAAERETLAGKFAEDDAAYVEERKRDLAARDFAAKTAARGLAKK